MLTALVVYVLGVAVGLLRIDASPLTRLTVALLWPLGVAAAAVTVTGLMLAALVLFPAVGVATVVAVAVLWYLAG